MAHSQRRLEIFSIIKDIRKKYKEIKKSQQTAAHLINQQFKPITEPLQELVRLQSSQSPSFKLDSKSYKPEPHSFHDYKQEPEPESYENFEPITSYMLKRADRRRKLAMDDSMLRRTKSLDSEAVSSTPHSSPNVSLIEKPDESTIEFEKTLSPGSFMQHTGEQTFIHDPQPTFIDQLQTTLNPGSSVQLYNILKSEYGDIAGDYLYKVFTDKNAADTVFGLRYDSDTEKFRLGKTEVRIRHSDVIIQHNNKFLRFGGTPGFFSLLTMKKPSFYKEEDLKKYKKILEITNAHKLFSDPTGKLKGNKSYKYLKIIKPLFEKTGGNIEMVVSNNPIDYVYYNDPNELVDRLQLLMASQQAGNNSHHNEIASIFEELKEMGIIE